MRDSWSCGNQKPTDGKTFAQPAHDRRTGWTLRGSRYPPTLTALRMTAAARQYSAASMIVRTRTVWRGSLGSSLPQVSVGS
jgi:hypothetical protein